MKVALRVNGQDCAVEAPPLKRLLDVLREDLQLTGTKEGCGEGECGACSVVLNGELVNSCLIPVCQLQSAEVLTVEGIASENGELAPVQQSFIECGAAQCGICTPGMLIAAHSFLQSRQPATERAVREALAGNLCRCTGYQKIIDAVLKTPLPLGEGRGEGN